MLTSQSVLRRWKSCEELINVENEHANIREGEEEYFQGRVGGCQS